MIQVSFPRIKTFFQKFKKKDTQKKEPNKELDDAVRYELYCKDCTVTDNKMCKNCFTRILCSDELFDIKIKILR
jgi:hypothetical protein